MLLWSLLLWLGCHQLPRTTQHRDRLGNLLLQGRGPLRGAESHPVSFQDGVPDIKTASTLAFSGKGELFALYSVDNSSRLIALRRAHVFEKDSYVLQTNWEQYFSKMSVNDMVFSDNRLIFYDLLSSRVFVVSELEKQEWLIPNSYNWLVDDDFLYFRERTDPERVITKFDLTSGQSISALVNGTIGPFNMVLMRLKSLGKCSTLLIMAIWDDNAPWVRAFDADNLQLCWGYKFNVDIYPQQWYGSLCGDEEYGMIYYCGQYMDSRMLVAFHVTPDGAKFLSRYPHRDVVTVHAPSSKLVVIPSTGWYELIERCTSLTCKLGPGHTLYADNIDLVTPDAIFGTQFRDDSYFTAFDPRTGSSLWDMKNERDSKYFVFDGTSLMKTVDGSSKSAYRVYLLSELPTAAVEPAEPHWQDVLMYIHYLLVFIVFAFSACLRYRDSPYGDDGYYRLSANGMKSGKCGDCCCDGLRVHPVVTICKLFSLAIQIILTFMTVEAFAETRTSLKTWTDRLSMDSIETFRAKFVEDCIPSVPRLPMNEFCFCGKNPACPSVGCQRSPNQPSCEDLARTMCSCDASFYYPTCHGPTSSCDFTFPNCSSTSVTFVNPKPFPSFKKCSSQYQDYSSVLQTSMIMHIVIASLTLLGGTTSLCNIPLGVLQLIFAIVNMVMVGHITTDMACTGSNGFFSQNFSGCRWRTGVNTDFAFIEGKAVNGLKLAKALAFALNNVGIGGGLLNLLDLIKCICCRQ